jgi:hypothetical protein
MVTERAITADHRDTSRAHALILNSRAYALMMNLFVFASTMRFEIYRNLDSYKLILNTHSENMMTKYMRDKTIKGKDMI